MWLDRLEMCLRLGRASSTPTPPLAISHPTSITERLYEKGESVDEEGHSASYYAFSVKTPGASSSIGRVGNVGGGKVQHSPVMGTPGYTFGSSAFPGASQRLSGPFNAPPSSSSSSSGLSHRGTTGRFVTVINTNLTSTQNDIIDYNLIDSPQEREERANLGSVYGRGLNVRQSLPFGGRNPSLLSSPVNKPRIVPSSQNSSYNNNTNNVGGPFGDAFASPQSK
eukprot:gene33203-40971_t